MLLKQLLMDTPKKIDLQGQWGAAPCTRAPGQIFFLGFGLVLAPFSCGGGVGGGSTTLIAVPMQVSDDMQEKENPPVLHDSWLSPLAPSSLALVRSLSVASSRVPLHAVASICSIGLLLGGVVS